MVTCTFLDQIQPGWWRKEDVSVEEFYRKLEELSHLELDCRGLEFTHCLIRTGRVIGQIALLDVVSAEIRLGVISADGIRGRYGPLMHDVELREISR